MKTKYTPIRLEPSKGKWFVARNLYGEPAVASRTTKDSEPKMIAVCYGDSPFFDSCLMAYAPEMLKLLERVVESQIGKHLEFSNEQNLIEQIRETIRKINGGGK